uniref:Predicted ATPase n=1 Tax=Candidatus Kentrum sp. LFY TaxID=2126342 RepID=A0A450U5A8_9GAMM|nr:MAG: Predicted ATPase [Candidatus Kentron sp. LFY]
MAQVFGEQSLGIVVCVSFFLWGEIGQYLQVLPSTAQFGEVVTRGQQNKAILIEIKFRMPIAEVDRLVTYHLEIGMDRNRPIVEREVLKYKRGRYGSPCHFLDFEHGEGFAITNEEDFDKEDEDLNREFQELDSPDILAIKGIGQFNRFKAANAFRKLLENWHVSDFHIDAARGDKDAGYAEHLSASGDNLVLVAQFLYEEHRETFERVLERMKQRVPGVEEIKAEQMINGRLVLRFRDGSFKEPFIDRYVSDGTIKMFAYLLLLNDPAPHPLLCVEEPENQLYPILMPELAEEFLEYSDRGGQVFVSTHSPDFLNEIPLESIYWLEKVNGVTQVHRASEDQQLVDLIEEGDKPGYLWKQRLFGETFF